MALLSIKVNDKTVYDVRNEYDSEKLNAAIAESGMSIKELAEELGITERTFKEKLGGKRRWLLREASALAGLLNVGVEELFFKG